MIKLKMLKKYPKKKYDSHFTKGLSLIGNYLKCYYLKRKFVVIFF